MAYYSYAKDCGCGNNRCNGGWIYWNGSEYPCLWWERQEKLLEKKKKEANEDRSSS